MSTFLRSWLPSVRPVPVIEVDLRAVPARHRTHVMPPCCIRAEPGRALEDFTQSRTALIAPACCFCHRYGTPQRKSRFSHETGVVAPRERVRRLLGAGQWVDGRLKAA